MSVVGSTPYSPQDSSEQMDGVLHEKINSLFLDEVRAVIKTEYHRSLTELTSAYPPEHLKDQGCFGEDCVRCEEMLIRYKPYSLVFP
jgi:hypothetical protein